MLFTCCQAFSDVKFSHPSRRMQTCIKAQIFLGPSMVKFFFLMKAHMHVCTSTSGVNNIGCSSSISKVLLLFE